jgi:hypothetical protein
MGGRSAGTLLRQAGVVAAGLVLGVGGFAYFDRDAKPPAYQPPAPSISEFAFATTLPEGPPREPETLPVLGAEPATPRAAVTAFAEALADGRPVDAYPLLDDASRRRYPTVASWVRAQADRATPLTFTVGTSRPSTDRPGAFEVDLSATHTSSLDPIRGLVPARSTSVWLVRLENDAYRVSVDPLAFRPVLPGDASATAAVQGWVNLLAACDTAAAAALQVSPNLYGPAALARTPCETRGPWTAGEPAGLDRSPDPRAFLAAFGPEVGTWARLVPVRGPAGGFLAAVAPMGDGWQVMGVAVDAP